jgi:uncharacterized oxidoreductase
MEDLISKYAAGVNADPDRLHAFVADMWSRLGSTDSEARLLADHLVLANLSGHDSHGVGMIPRYLRSLQEGRLTLNRHARLARDAGALLTVDGEMGFGQVVAHEAMQHGIARAGQLGICAVALRNAHHIGRIGHWAEQCAEAGMVSFHFVNVAGDPLVAPFGGSDARIGTNPFCAAFPRQGKPPLVLDFATSRVAFGKTRVAYNKGALLPAGCVIDHEGRPSEDPRVMHEQPRGALLPFGGHKGYGLAAMCEIFAGALAGGFTTHADTLAEGSVIINCMLSVIIDPQGFDAPASDMEAEAFLAWVKASPLAEGADEVLAPGEPEQRLRVERRAAGIPIDRATCEQLVACARHAGMPEERIAALLDGAA